MSRGQSKCRGNTAMELIVEFLFNKRPTKIFYIVTVWFIVPSIPEWRSQIFVGNAVNIVLLWSWRQFGPHPCKQARNSLLSFDIVHSVQHSYNPWYSPTCAQNKIQIISRRKLLHVSAPRCILRKLQIPSISTNTKSIPRLNCWC